MLNTKQMLTLRMIRNAELKRTDIAMFEDYEVGGEPISPEQKQEILSVRKQLKDITDQAIDADDISDIVFPKMPTWFKG